MDLHFVRPLWLLALLPLVLLLWRLFRQEQQKGAWSQVIAPQFQTLLLPQNTESSPRLWPLVGLGLIWLLAIIALSGPTWKQVKMPAESNLQGTVVVFDLSLSMLADDLKPNRLSRAQFKLRDLLTQHPEMAVGMVVYAGSAHTLTPISQDNQTLLGLLPNISPTMMPNYGANPLEAMELAKHLIEGAQVKQGHIIWITDDLEPKQEETLKDFFNSNNLTLAIYGVGTALGGPVKIPDFGLLKDEEGRIVLPKLPLERLQDFANELDSPLQLLSLNNSDVDTLLPPTLVTSQTATKAGDDENTTQNPYLDAWIEEGVWLLWGLVVLAALAFRRGWLLSWVALPVSLVFLQPTPTVYAAEEVLTETTEQKAQPSKSFMPELIGEKRDTGLSFTDAFITPDRQGYLLFEKQDYARAETRFESAEWKGASLYRLGQYAKAAEQFARVKTPEGFYNLGNALAKQGKLDEAKIAYEAALKQQPNFKQAQDNLDLIEQILNQQKPTEPPKPNQQAGQNAQTPKPSNEQNAQKDNSQNSQPNADNDLKNGGQSTDPRDKNAEQQAKQNAGETPNKNAQQNSEQSQGSEQAQQQGESDAAKEGQENAQAGGQQAGQDMNQESVQAADTQQKLENSDENGEQPSKLGEQSDTDLNQEALKAQGQMGSAAALGKTEKQQATQTWLNQIPDEPQLFLKRKFDYQYQQQAPSKAQPNDKIW
ncbi:VWA domain-containing protein [Thiosulfativibrio zosterae]|uniref:VWFA domain-containing protein n=1 Tax=Thiosulfativibrio zosterae TaxID=2675053 RepID=A0A6F8PJV7_9GAMM|nr:VWA domain-containing protein [Thiosulfativibrio zosterae]BBP42344.1 hypothetical protein THMIRHAT_00900 [Thiosulfativibrio zosterae]